MVALLQFDAVSLQILERLLAEDRLPTLAALKRRGMWVPIDAAATILQSATYPTLFTGIDVSDHGLYSSFPWSAADQRARFMHTFPKPPTLWERLTRRGRRSLVVDPILAWPPDHMAGAFISGWNFEDRMVSQARSVPRGLRSVLARRLGRPPQLDDVYGRRETRLLLEWRRHLIAAPARTARMAVELIEKEPFDFVWVNFSAAHKAGHQFWDPAAVVDAPLSPDVEEQLRTGLDAVYVEVDAAIGRILDALPPGADVIVFSPTGMGANTSRADLLPGMLRAVMRGKGRAQAPSREAGAPVWALRSRVPARWRSSLARLLPDSVVADMTTRFHLRADWRRTRAVAVPGENKGYIRFNLRGREREGIVTPAETGELRQTIANGLLTFRDPDGAPAISRVAAIEEIAPSGPARDRLPDLVVYWSDRSAGRVTGAVSSEYGDVQRPGVGSGRSGNHLDDAWAILLPSTSTVRDVGRPARVTDLAATVCHLLGAETAGLSGAPLLQ